MYLFMSYSSLIALKSIITNPPVSVKRLNIPSKIKKRVHIIKSIPIAPNSKLYCSQIDPTLKKSNVNSITLKVITLINNEIVKCIGILM